MGITDYINLIMQDGLAVVIVAYFIYKDYKFNEQLRTGLERIGNNLVLLNQKLEVEVNEHGKEDGN